MERHTARPYTPWHAFLNSSHITGAYSSYRPGVECEQKAADTRGRWGIPTQRSSQLRVLLRPVMKKGPGTTEAMRTNRACPPVCEPAHSGFHTQPKLGRAAAAFGAPYVSLRSRDPTILVSRCLHPRTARPLTTPFVASTASFASTLDPRAESFTLSWPSSGSATCAVGCRALMACPKSSHDTVVSGAGCLSHLV